MSRRHGTISNYTSGGCRCDECKAAWAKSRKEYMDRNPDQREKSRAHARLKYAENPEKTRARHRAKYAEGKTMTQGTGN